MIGKYLRNEKRIGNVAIWLIILLSFGHVLTSTLAALLNLSSTPVNIAARVVYLLLSIYLIGVTFLKNSAQRITWGGLFILIFWVLYSVRLIYDISYRGILHLQEQSPFETYSFAFGSCLLPTIGLVFTSKYIDLDKIPNKVFWVLLIANVSIILLLTTNIGFSLSLFSDRATVRNDKTGGKQVINPITIAHFGSSLFLTALSMLTIFRNNRFFKRIVLYLALCLGLLVLVVGSSRSPMIYTIVLTVMIFFAHFKSQSLNIKYLLNVVVVSFCLSVAVVKISQLVSNSEISIISRFLSFADDRKKGGKEERDFEYDSAWKGFMESPIIGNKYIQDYDYSYPHNVFLETLMALGVVGMFILLGILFFIFYRVFTLPFQYYYLSLPCILVLQAWALSLTSGGLFLSSNFWVLSAFWVSLRQPDAKEPLNMLVSVLRKSKTAFN